jgi:hypothetical protein
MKNLTNLDALPPSVKDMPRSGVSWWPAMLKGNLDVEKIHRAGFKFYVIEEPGPPNTDILLFAIDWTNGRGFFFRTTKQ